MQTFSASNPNSKSLNMAAPARPWNRIAAYDTTSSCGRCSNVTVTAINNICSIGIIASSLRLEYHSYCAQQSLHIRRLPRLQSQPVGRRLTDVISWLCRYSLYVRSYSCTLGAPGQADSPPSTDTSAKHVQHLLRHPKHAVNPTQMRWAPRSFLLTLPALLSLPLHLL